MSVRLFVGNLNFRTTAETLGKLFEAQGEVQDAVIIASGSYSRGYGFVNMKDEPSAHRAVAALNNYELDGRQIRIEIARPRREPGERPPPRRSSFRAPRRFGRRQFAPRRRRPPTEGPPSTTRVHLSNLPFNLTDEELKAEFAGYSISEAVIIRGIDGRSRGYGFVEFTNEADQARALREKATLTIKNRPATLQAARIRPTPSAGGPPA
jgi:RNA recognition motif-containing protein